MFDTLPKARAVLKAGTCYAVCGEENWIYFGQVGPDKQVGFFRERAKSLIDAEVVLRASIMSVVTVAYPSVSRALRLGHWKKLGQYPLAADLAVPPPSVLWSVGTLEVEVWDGTEEYQTSVDDPRIQLMERAAVWDAVKHIPKRLTADLGEEEADWHVGGPIWRERKVVEEYARRFPDAPWHQLPFGWVPTSV